MFNLTPSRRSRQNTPAHRRHPLDLLRNEFDNMFDRFFGSWPALSEMGQEVETMRFWDFSTQDKGTEFVVRAELPGFDADDVNVNLEDNVLTISAEKKQEGEKEQQFSQYSRTLTLPHGLDAEKAQANYHNGVLELHFPKLVPSPGKRIQVQSAAPKSQTSEKAPAEGNQAKGKKS
jgi:HSP20 family protein